MATEQEITDALDKVLIPGAMRSLASLNLDGWRVSFSKYKLFNGYELPGSIVFVNDAGQGLPHLRGRTGQPLP